MSSVNTNNNTEVDSEATVPNVVPNVWNNSKKPWQKTKKPVVNVVVDVLNVPDEVAQMVVEEVLTLVGNRDWNNPENVSKTVAEMMSIDLDKPIETQEPKPFNIDRTIFLPGKAIICQSVIRVQENHKKFPRHIEHNGTMYNKVDIIFNNQYFKGKMDMVTKEGGFDEWYALFGNSTDPKKKLYKKTHAGKEESWLDKCVGHLLTPEDVNGLNIRNILMVGFKKNLNRIE